ncbi:hypothetical protein HA402_002870 [Bradysia odoriphaga]|nr:hypothetical protein HA402_002870 [Bradysia odoriphaga]
MFNTKMDGRPNILLAQIRHPNNVNKGVFFTQGLLWRDERRFTLRHLRDFGFGRRFTELELDLEEELRQLVEIIKYGPKYAHEKELFHDGMASCPNIFNALAANSFLKVMCNERISREKQGMLLRAAKDTYKFAKLGQSYGRMMSILPWVVKVFPNLSGYNEIRPAVDGQYEFMKMFIDEQYRTYDDNHERHFLDVYFKEMKAAERNKHFRNAEFSYDQLIMTCVDFFMATSVAIPLAVAYLVRLLILNPHMKQRAQGEIDRVVGRSRLPTLSDRTELPYTEACIRESLRYNTLIPNGIPRVALESTTLSEYDIPANCVIGIGLRSAHLDSNKWDNPNKFQPERFLNNDGKLNLKTDLSIPFGAGKRLCAGETHARNLMFLLTTTILQNFDISVPVESNLPRDSDFVTGIASMVPDFFVKFEAR